MGSKNNVNRVFSRRIPVRQSVGNTEFYRPRILLRFAAKTGGNFFQTKKSGRLESRCFCASFFAEARAQRLLNAPHTARRVRQCRYLHPDNPVLLSGADVTLRLYKHRRSDMKILTNVALATCVGLSLGWMSSCSSDRTVETTMTREVETAPPPTVVTSAPVVTEPAVVVPGASTATTTTQFNNGTVEKRTVTSGYPAGYPEVVTPAPVVVTTPPAETTTTTSTNEDGDITRRTTTTTDPYGDVQRQTTTTTVTP